MKFIASIRTFASALFHRARVEREIDEELRAHIENRAADLERSGLPHAEAERQAKIEFGGYEAAKEESRDALGISFIESIFGDIRFGLRMLRKSPGFTAIAIITLALGIGANTVIFSAVHGILLKPLPYPNSGRLVQIDAVRQESGHLVPGVSIPEVRDVRTQCSAFASVAFWVGEGRPTLLGGSAPLLTGETLVSGNFFGLVGVRPLLGRPILPSDTAPGSNNVAVLDYGTWRSDFGGDPKVLGKTITLDGKPYRVVGVMPPRFHLSPYLGFSGGTLWLPFVPHGRLGIGRTSHNYVAIARLRLGATLTAANAQLKALSSRLAAAYMSTEKGLKLSAQSEKNWEIGSSVPSELLLLLAAVGVTLLIACVNVSSMLLARGFSRQHEVAIREALGATRPRILRQFLIESVLLSLAGGACGLLVAIWGVPLLRAIAPAGTPRIDQVRLDAGVLYFTLGASVIAGILFGLAPALQVSAGSAPTTIRERVATSGSAFGGKRSNRLQGALVISEVALAVILAGGATLVARSLQKLMAVPLGYRTNRILTVSPVLVGTACADVEHPQPCRLAASQILRRLKALPGVESATVAGNAPMWGGYGSNRIEIQRGRKTTEIRTGNALNWVAPSYFRVMGIPLLAGRDFTEGDTGSSQRVATVNRAFSRQYLGRASPLGRRIALQKDKNGTPEWMEVVGEVADVHERTVARSPVPEIYMPTTQDYATGFSSTFLLRTTKSVSALIPFVRRAVWSVDKDAPIWELKTMNQIVAIREAGPRFRTLLLGAFGVLGVLLAIVGIYGVISYSVSQRMHEVGIRMAMGAQPGDVLRMVLREGAILAGAGIVIGIGGALALTRLLRSFLFEISPTDPATFAGVAIALALVALLACWIPARRAARLDPMTVLRQE